MGRLSLRFSAAVVALLPLADLALLLAEPPAQPQRRALLVGVSTYSQAGFADQPLPYSAPDMELLAQVLRQHGWEVQLLTSQGTQSTATRAHILAGLDQLLKGTKASDLILVALSGHGQQLRAPVEIEEGKFERREEAFFCPGDAEKDNPKSLLGMTELMRRLGRKGGQNLVLVDACRDAPHQGSVKGVDGSIVRDLPENTSILFSCRAGQRSYETNRMYGPGALEGHGVFFHRVLKGLKGEARNVRGEVTWDSLQSYVRENVNRDAVGWFPGQAVESASGKKVVQTPHLVGSLVDEPPVLLRLKVGPATPETRVELPRTPEPKPVPSAPAPPAPKPESRVKAPAPLELDLGDDVKLKLVHIPAAGKSFWMGSPGSEDDREADEAQHRVEFTRDYWLAVTETTQLQYWAIMRQNPSQSVGASYPVENVSWDLAQLFCRRLNDRFRDQKLVFRLPTEAEWEYAARGGATEKDTRPFAFKEGPTDMLTSEKANFDGSQPYPFLHSPRGSSVGRTTRVASYAPNRFGLYDMHGNVMEWCQDWYGPYSSLKTSKDPVQDDYQGVNSRVLRGGAFFTAAKECRAAYRYNKVAPAYGGHFTGFRVACIPQSSK
jgi:formylglycine-generating enzyme required for sulfatase activity